MLDSLVPFVPSPILERQLLRPERIHGVYIPGTVVFADLSGFTTLASQLATAGRQSSEEISVIVNRLFAALLEEIYAGGGGVIKLGSDSLTAFFDAQLGRDHAALACAAAFAMQQRMADFAAVPTSKGSFELRLRIAVNSGRIFAVEVGDDAHTELVVTGRTINRIMILQEGAAPGEVVISNETRQALGEAQVQEKLKGLYLLHKLRSAPRPLLRGPQPANPDTPSLATLTALLQRIRIVRPYLPHGLPRPLCRHARER